MKTIALTVFLILLVNNINASDKCRTEEWMPKTDSVYSYKWDNVSKQWVDPSIQINITDPATGLLKELLVSNVASGEYISRQTFEYNEKGMRTVQQFINWEDGEWVNYRRNLTNYSDEDLISDILIQYWKEDSWVDEIWQKNYTYNDQEQLTYFEFYGWKNEEWVLGRYDYWNYNEDDLLDYRLSTYTDGSNYYQIFYTYTDFDEWDVMTAQRWTDGGWENYWKRTYEYDHCGNLLTQVEQRWINGEWQNRTKMEYFYSFNSTADKHQRIPVCHNGHTIYIPASAIPAHLKHGDCLGECIDCKCHEPYQSRNHTKYSKPLKKYKSGGSAYKSESAGLQDDALTSIRVYPNPFFHELTIELGQAKQNLKKIELIDFAGKTVWESPSRGEEFVRISRTNLPDGIYFLKIISDEVYMEKVIIETR